MENCTGQKSYILLDIIKCSYRAVKLVDSFPVQASPVVGWSVYQTFVDVHGCIGEIFKDARRLFCLHWGVTSSVKLFSTRSYFHWVVWIVRLVRGSGLKAEFPCQVNYHYAVSERKPLWTSWIGQSIAKADNSSPQPLLLYMEYSTKTHHHYR